MRRASSVLLLLHPLRDTRSRANPLKWFPASPTPHAGTGGARVRCGAAVRRKIFGVGGVLLYSEIKGILTFWPENNSLCNICRGEILYVAPGNFWFCTKPVSAQLIGYSKWWDRCARLGCMKVGAQRLGDTGRGIMRPGCSAIGPAVL